MPALPSLSPLPALRSILIALVAALVLPTVSALPAAALESCTDTPTAGYVARVCLVAPESGSTLGGDVTVTARVEFVVAAGAVPAVDKVVYHYRGGYLLSDHDPVPGGGGHYDFLWRTTRLIDGPGTLEVKARLDDGVVARHTVPVTLANGQTTAPVNTDTFEVRRGTTPAPGARLRVAAVGDAAAGSPLEESLADQIESWQPNLVTYLGDVYERGSAFEFDNWYGSKGTGARAFGRFRGITNPAVGNHEYLTPGAAGYFDYWDNVPHYYSYDIAGWHFVSLDSNPQYDQLRPGTAQYDWLAADLGANRARCTMVYFHHPRFSVGAHENRIRLQAVWDLLAARRVTLAVTGHTHHYERWTALDGAGQPHPRGVTQLVAGAGGHELTPPVRTDGRLAALDVEAGALRLDLGDSDAAFAYVTATGEVRDSGTVGCTSTGDPLPPTTPTGLQVSPTSTTTATLQWQPSTDQYSSVAGYTVRRDGQVIATVDSATTSYADSGLSPGASYTWTVDAFDTSENVSAPSHPVFAMMPTETLVQVSSRSLLAGLTTRKETTGGYLRSRFRTWVDADGDGCDTRSEVLLSEAQRTPTLFAVCRISGGRWFSAFDGVTTANRAALGIEHAVPLAEAWQSGARRWTGRTRTAFANDLSYRPTLDVATSRVLRARGASEPQRWLPPRFATRCTYVADWVAVKWRWRLRVDKEERRFLARKLSACGWPLVTQPVRASR